MICQMLDVLNIHFLPYVNDHTDSMTCLRPHLVITTNSFEVASPGLGTLGLHQQKYEAVSLRMDLKTTATTKHIMQMSRPTQYVGLQIPSQFYQSLQFFDKN